jgi:hypothetical protein
MDEAAGLKGIGAPKKLFEVETILCALCSSLKPPRAALREI